MQLNSITSKFKSHAKWKPEEFHQVFCTSLERIGQIWPFERKTTRQEWNAYDEQLREIHSAELTGNMHLFRTACENLEAICRRIVSGEIQRETAGGKILF